MTSSSEARVIRRGDVGGASPLATPDLRSGTWTRRGSSSLLGDLVTEGTLTRIADQTREAAEAEGYAAGWAAGQRGAAEAARLERETDALLRAEEEVRRETEHRSALDALRQAADQLREQTVLARASVDEQVLELATAVTEVVLGEVAAQSVPADVVRRVLAVLPSDVDAVVRLHPEVARSIDATDLGAGVVVEADPTMSKADALVQLEEHVVDLRVATTVRRLREALS